MSAYMEHSRQTMVRNGKILLIRPSPRALQSSSSHECHVDEVLRTVTCSW